MPVERLCTWSFSQAMGERGGLRNASFSLSFCGDDDGAGQPRRLQDLDLAQHHRIRLDAGGRGVLLLGEPGQAVVEQDVASRPCRPAA